VFVVETGDDVTRFVEVVGAGGPNSAVVLCTIITILIMVSKAPAVHRPFYDHPTALMHCATLRKNCVGVI